MSKPSYHDVYITTADIPRTALTDLPFRFHVSCCRVAGWEVFSYGEGRPVELMGGEYDEKGLILDVAGYVLVDSLTRKLEEA